MEIQKRSYDSAESMNQRLHGLYISRLPEVYNSIRQSTSQTQLQGIHGPFIMHVHPEYVNAPKKLMFVGREARNEGLIDIDESPEDAYYRATKFYENFTGGLSYDHTPFWKFIRALNQLYEITDYRKSSLWTNLSKVNVNGRRPEGNLLNETMPNFLDILIKEIKIVKPEIVVILTRDPTYQRFVREKFHITKENYLLNILSDVTPPFGCLV